MKDNKIPCSWVKVLLGYDAEYKKGKKPKELKAANDENLVPYIDIKAFEKGLITKFAKPDSGILAFPTDSLMVWDGARSGLVGNGIEGVIGSTLMRIRPIVSDIRYFHYFLQSKYQEINSKTKGTGIPHVDPQML